MQEKKTRGVWKFVFLAAVLFADCAVRCGETVAGGKPASEIRWRSIGLASSGWMRSISADPRDENVLWAVADMGGGILRTINGGRSWEDVTYSAIRDTQHGNFANIFVHPGGRIFVGYRSSFIFTDDQGKTWQTTDARLEIDPTWMEFQEARPNVIYSANNLGTVFRSVDTGKTWTTVFAEPQKGELQKDKEFRVGGYSSKIRAVPAEGSPGYVLYRSHPHFGVTMSTDEGKTWTECNSGLPHKEVISLDTHYDAKAKDLLLFALLQAKLNAQGDGWIGGVYVSGDGGKSWTERNKGILTHVPPQFLAKHLPDFNSLEASKKVRGLLYVLGGNVCDRLVALLRSDDAGANWTCLHTNYVNVNTNGEPREICRIPYRNMISLAQSNPDILYCFASSPMLRFEERGRIARQIEYQPIDFQTGKYRWLGVSHLCTKNVAADPVKDFVHAISHDVGYNRVDLKEGVVDFRSIRHSPWSQGNSILVDPANPGTVFFGGSESSTYKSNPKKGAIFKSTDHGCTFHSTQDRKDSGLPSGFIFDLALDPKSPKEGRRVYASVGGAGVYASDDGGETWRSIHENLPPVSEKTIESNVHRLHVDDKGGVYAVLYSGAALHDGGTIKDFAGTRAFYKPDKGAPWQEVKSIPALGGIVLDILSEPGNPSVLYAAADTGIHKSEDAGKTWKPVLENTKENIKKNCAPIRLAIHPARKNRIWVLFSGSGGYDDKWGVWASEDGGANWKAANTGLGFFRNTDLSVDAKDPDVVYVATLGSGCFRGSFDEQARAIVPAKWEQQAVPPADAAGNLVGNPSAEQVADGKPVGWGLYTGACGGPVAWGASDGGFEGSKCAFIEVPKMYVSKSTLHPGELYISAALIPAENDGYHARNACPAQPNTVHRMSFRVKGDVPCATIRVAGWPKTDADNTERQDLATSMKIVNPAAEWKGYDVIFLTKPDTRCIAPTFAVAGYESEGFQPGQRLCIDDVCVTAVREIDAKEPADHGKAAPPREGPKAASADPARPAHEIEWESIGSGANGWMRSLAVDAHDENTLWAVADMGAGINVTRNGGRSWRDVTYNAIRDTLRGGFGYIFLSADGDVFVAGSGFLIRSRDGGETWKQLDVDPEKYLAWIEFHPTNPKLIYLINFLGNISRSRDGGDTWEKVFSEKDLPALEKNMEYRRRGFSCRIKIVPAKNEQGYVLFKNHPHFGVSASRDEGKTWQLCTAGLPHNEVESIDYQCNADSGAATVYALVQARLDKEGTHWEGGVYASRDYGQTWERRSDGMFTHVPPKYIGAHLPFFLSLDAAKKAEGLLYVFARDLCDRRALMMITEDGGRRWTPLGTEFVGLDPDRKFTSLSEIVSFSNAIALAPSNPDVFYGITSAPILRFDQRGKFARQIEYEVLSPENDQHRYRWLGVSHVCVRGVAPDPNRELVHTINHDVGYDRVDLRKGIVDIFRSKTLTGQGKVWRQGNGILADPANPGVIYVGGSDLSWWEKGIPKNGGIFKSTDYGLSFRSTLDRPECGLPGGYVFTIQLDPRSPKNARVLYASIGGHGVFRSADGGETWRSIHGNMPPVNQTTGENNVPCLHVDDRGGVYAIVHCSGEHYTRKKTRDRIFHSTAGDGNWREVADTAQFEGNVFDLITEPGSPDVLYLTSYPGVFRSDDAGKTWNRVLENTEANLKSDCHPFLLAIHPKKKDRVWVMFTSRLGCADKWGVWVSEDRGGAWRDANKGLCHSRLAALSVDPNSPDVLYVGTTGVGVFRGSFNPERREITPADWRDDRVLMEAKAEAGPPRRVRAEYSEEKIAPDGRFSEKVWKKGEAAGGFFGPGYPKKQVEERQQSSFSVAYDKDCLAVRVRCSLLQPLRLSPGAAPRKHDGPAWQGEGVELFIETKLSKEFECISQLIASCEGDKADLRYFGTIGVMEWNAEPMWEAKPVLRDNEYEMLFLIPFKSLDMACPKPGDVLRLKVCRNPSLFTWTPVGYLSPLRDFGEIQF